MMGLITFRPAEIEEQRYGVERIGEETVQNHHSDNGFVLFQTQDVNEKGQDVGASRKGHAGDDVEADPEAPWKVLVEVGDGAQTVSEAVVEDHRRGRHDARGDHVEGREKLSLGTQLLEKEAPSAASPRRDS